MSTNHDLDFATGGSISANGGSVGLMLPSLCTGTQYAITGTWVGTLTLQASYDNVNWVSVVDVASSSAYTSNNASLVKTSPYQFFRIVATAWTSGTANIALQPVSNIAPVSGGGGGGGGEVTIGDPTTATNQAAVLPPGSSGAFALSVQGVTGGTAQPISATALPLPTGAATAANQTTAGTAGTPSTQVLSVQGVAGGTAQPVSIAASVAVTGAFFQATQPISAVSLPLPTGAATAANQPNFSTAGTPATNVLTVQGSPSGTAIPTSLATLPALVASTAAIGQVGGKTAKIAVTPTVTAAAYAAGNLVGGLMTFSSALLVAGSGVLESISIRCKSIQSTPLIFALFDSNPTNSTWTNKTAPAINAADIPFLVGIYELATPFSSLGTHTIWNLNGISQTLAAGATTLYGVLVCLGTPTFASTSDITAVLGILQD